ERRDSAAVSGLTAGPVAPVVIRRYPDLVAAFPTMTQRQRKRGGLRVCRSGWLVGVSVREYRGMEAGSRSPDSVTWDRISRRRFTSSWAHHEALLCNRHSASVLGTVSVSGSPPRQVPSLCSPG